MGIGEGLLAAVNGYAAGRDVKHKWADRKTDNARQKRRDELVEQAEVRSQQSHDMNLETSGLMNQSRRQSIRETDQGWDDGQSMRGALAKADGAAMEGMLVRPDDVDLTPTASVSTKGRDADQIEASQRAATAPVMGAVRPAEPAIAAPPPRDEPQASIASVARRPGPAAAAAPQPKSQAPAQAPAPAMSVGPDGNFRAARMPQNDAEARLLGFADQMGGLGAPPDAVINAATAPSAGAANRGPVKVDLVRVRPDGMFVANRAPETAEEKRALIEAAKAGRLATTDDKRAQQREIDANAALDLPHEWGGKGNMLSDLDRAGRIGQRAANETLGRTAEMLANGAISSVQTLNAPLQAASNYATGADHIGAPSRIDLNKDGRTESTATPFADAWGAIRAEPQKAAPAHAPAADGNAAPESAKATAESAAAVMDEVTKSPGMKAAVDAIPASVLGVSRTTPLTKPQREKAAKSYMQSYRDNGAPLVMRELMKQGRLSDAKNFESWVKEGKAEEGMTSWGRGMFAAMQGDADGAADAFMDAYNNAGYFDDGMEVVKDKTSIIKDDSGEVVGVTLTMRDQATGEETSQTDSIDGFIQKAAWITSPEKAFEASSARIKAQQEALLKADEDRRASARKLVENNYGKTVDLARDMFSKSQAAYKEARDAAMLSGTADDLPPAKTWDEAFREAQRIMTDGPNAAAPDTPDEPPPIARRQ